jgi:hypothetical protein
LNIFWAFPIAFFDFFSKPSDGIQFESSIMIIQMIDSEFFKGNL